MSDRRFRTIVVGVDFSDYSKVVAKQALKLAEVYEAELVFVHALTSALYSANPVMTTDLGDLISPTEKEIFSFYKLKQVALKPRIVVAIGGASSLILDVAARAEAPLIVIGHKGATALGRFFLGSNAERLALHSPYPVWVHRGNTVRVPKKILLPCDFSIRSKKSFDIAKDFGNGGKNQLEFFHVQQLPAPILDAEGFRIALKKFKSDEARKKSEFRRAFPKVPVKALVGDPAPSIAKESRKFDLIAMAPHSREGLFSSFGSVTAKVVRNGDVPVLITH